MNPELLATFLDVSTKVALLGAVAYGSLRWIKATDAALRHRVLRTILLAILALPLLSVMSLGFDLPIVDRGGANSPPALQLAGVESPRSGLAQLPPAVPGIASMPRTAIDPGTGQHSANWPMFGLVIYLGGMLWMAGRLLIGLRLRRSLQRSAVAAQDSQLITQCGRLAQRAGLRRVPEVRIADAVSVPLAIGIWQPSILLPANWTGWTEAKLNSVLAHEIAHLRRADPLVQVLSVVNQAIYWFHPVSWWLKSKLSATAEQASDELAMRWTGDRRRYAMHLLEVASSLPPGGQRVAFAALPMARSSQIQNRIEAILDSAAGGVRASRSLRFLLASGLTLALVAASGVHLTAAPSEDSPAAAEATSAATDDLAKILAEALLDSDDSEVRQLIRDLESDNPNRRREALEQLRPKLDARQLEPIKFLHVQDGDWDVLISPTMAEPVGGFPEMPAADGDIPEEIQRLIAKYGLEGQLEPVVMGTEWRGFDGTQAVIELDGRREITGIEEGTNAPGSDRPNPTQIEGQWRTIQRTSMMLRRDGKMWLFVEPES